MVDKSTVISLQNVQRGFNNTPVISDVCIEIAEGERVGIIGPGGCGKTTLLKVMLGILAPEQGKVSLMGVDLAFGKEADRRRILRQVGMAFQQGALFDYMTVRENLIFAMENMTDFKPAQMDQRIEQLLAQVKLGRTLNQFPYELSGGMQRRVGIARALATDPKIAIFDEPTSGLDPVTSTIILNMIRDISSQREGTTTIIATSSVEIAIRFANRLLVMQDGRVVSDGPWRELLMTGPEWVRHFLGVRLKGIDREYAVELDLPKPFISQYCPA